MSEAQFMAKPIHVRKGNSLRSHKAHLEASSIATATATVMPTMGLLPAPMSPTISTLQRVLGVLKGTKTL